MTNHYSIKEIARLSGVSAGTVDRVIHKRGNVSKESEELVEEVLDRIGFHGNLHSSALSLRKNFKIIICTPEPRPGEFWGLLKNGFDMAIKEFSGVKAEFEHLYFNESDVFSCHAALEFVFNDKPDLVILSPVFTDETIKFCARLEKSGIPYITVVTLLEEIHPIVSLATDQYACGNIMARILNNITPAGGKIAVGESIRISDQISKNVQLRKKGFADYFSAAGNKELLVEAPYSVTSMKENGIYMLDFFQSHKDVKSIAVMDSKGYFIADFLREHEIEDIKIGTVHLTDNNIRCLRNGSLEIILSNKPMMQGYSAIRAALRYLVFRFSAHDEPCLLPIDVVLKENLQYHKDCCSFYF